MRCRFGHDHSTQPVKTSSYNRGRPSWEVPPFHCPGCSMTRPLNRIAKNWVTYKTMAEAKEAGHKRACRMCFPLSLAATEHPKSVLRCSSMTFLATVAGLILLIPFPAFAADFPNVTYHRCYDGDTCTFTIPDVHPLFGEKINVRIAGANRWD